jgi:hypothetical protein
MAPEVESLGVHPRGTGDFSHAFPLWLPADSVNGGPIRWRISARS